MLNYLSLSMQIRQRTRTDGLCLVRQRLTRLQALRAAIQPICPRQQLLALLELHIIRVVRVSAAEESRAVVGQGAKFPLCGVDVGFVVAEALVYFRSGCGGDVLLFEAHLIKL